jgi:hypothetical protein
MAADDDKITAFDKAHYEQLISYLTNVDNDIDTNPKYLGPSVDLKLDNTLTARFHPGSTDWSIAKDFLTQANAFGNSVHTRLAGLDVDLRKFYTALKNAEAIFDKTNDLSTYDASKFGQDYPDLTDLGGPSQS